MTTERKKSKEEEEEEHKPAESDIEINNQSQNRRGLKLTSTTTVASEANRDYEGTTENESPTEEQDLAEMSTEKMNRNAEGEPSEGSSPPDYEEMARKSNYAGENSLKAACFDIFIAQNGKANTNEPTTSKASTASTSQQKNGGQGEGSSNTSSSTAKEYVSTTSPFR